MSNVLNFNAGPSMLPAPVLEQVQSELRSYHGSGMSIMEMSHRSKEYEAVNSQAEATFKKLLGLGEGYRVLFLQGGASTQFAMVPLNFLPPGASADYVLTGVWSEKAVEEVKIVGSARVVASSEKGGFRSIPRVEPGSVDTKAAYFHLTSNETIQGIQWKEFPDTSSVPLVADMSSDILSQPFDASRFSLIYAGAQKNLGPSGVTAVVIRESWLQSANKNVPTMLRYSTHVKNNSLYNTPPSFGVYVLNLVLSWIEKQGGLAGIGKRNAQKAGVLYQAIDESQGFYRGHADVDSRSLMNVTFRLGTEALEKKFASEALAAGMIGLPGHRLVGGLRASIYNAVPLEACTTLAQFMKEFARKNG